MQESMVKLPVGWFCCMDHAMGYASDKRSKAKDRERKNQSTSSKRETRKRLNELDRPKHLDKLQDLVNQYVVQVRDVDKPCCTCGTTSQSVQYAAGHYRSRGACQELRFNLFNIHKQCNVKCNKYGSGMRSEYRDFIVETYGQDMLDWLDGSHDKLKAQLPDADAIESEIARYRKLLRDAGVKPKR